MWDTVDNISGQSGGGTLNLDLADFSAAALRFRTETREMRKEVDALDGLISDGPLEEAGNSVPEWADYEEENSAKNDLTFSGAVIEEKVLQVRSHKFCILWKSAFVFYAPSVQSPLRYLIEHCINIYIHTYVCYTYKGEGWWIFIRCELSASGKFPEYSIWRFRFPIAVSTAAR